MLATFFLFFCLHSLRCLTVSLLGLWARHLPSSVYWKERSVAMLLQPQMTATLQKPPNFIEVLGGGAAFLGESGTSVAKILGEVFCIFLPCLRTSKTANVHLRPRPYYSKYVLKLFFYSYTKGTAELAWIPETQTKKVSLTHHLDRKQERSIALDHTWARRRREETFPSVPHSHRNLSGGHNSYSAA